MNKIISSVVIIAVSLGFIGCVPPQVDVPYKQLGDSKPYGLTGVGYSEFKIGENKYKVTYAGEANDSDQKVMKFTYKRAIELCVYQGFNKYDITNTNGISKGIATTSVNVETAGLNQYIYTLDVECKHQ